MIKISQPSVGKEELKAIEEVLKSGQLAQGPKVKELEGKYAKFIGTKYAVAVVNGTAALHLALLANNIKEGGEVITSPFSFEASSNSILYCKARPIFVDIEPETFNINAELIEKKITKKTKAILPISLYGQCCNIKKIMEIASAHGLKVIEDACQSHGSSFDGKKAGSFGTGCFSFYATKNMMCAEGGMITTNDKNVEETARKLRQHGEYVRYYQDSLGYNYRMNDVIAAIAIEQLKKLPKWNEQRKKNAEFLTKNLKDVEGIIVPYVDKHVEHVFYLYTIRVTSGFKLNRDELQAKLKEKGVEAIVFYPVLIPNQKYYKSIGFGGHYAEAEKATAEVLSLPVHPSLSKGDLKKIVESIKEET